MNNPESKPSNADWLADRIDEISPKNLSHFRKWKWGADFRIERRVRRSWLALLERAKDRTH